MYIINNWRSPMLLEHFEASREYPTPWSTLAEIGAHGKSRKGAPDVSLKIGTSTQGRRFRIKAGTVKHHILSVLEDLARPMRPKLNRPGESGHIQFNPLGGKAKSIAW